MISLPLIQRSKDSNVAAWLLLPIIGCALFGALIAFSTTSSLNTRTNAAGEASWTRLSWIGPLFMAAGGKFLVSQTDRQPSKYSHCIFHTFLQTGLFLVSALLFRFLHTFSILNTGDKRITLFAVFGLILISFSLLVMLTTTFSACIAFSLSLEQLPIEDDLRGDIACFLDQSGSCTACDEEDGRRCPEWSNEEVTKILQTQTKAAAALAAIFLVYAASNLRHSFTMRTHIINYQIEYV